MLEDKKYRNILTLLNDNFNELSYEIIQDAKLREEYQELINIRELFLNDFPVFNKLELLQPVSIKEEDLRNLKEYHDINKCINQMLMKESYFRGIKDMILMLARANLFKESQ